MSMILPLGQGIVPHLIGANGKNIKYIINRSNGLLVRFQHSRTGLLTSSMADGVYMYGNKFQIADGLRGICEILDVFTTRSNTYFFKCAPSSDFGKLQLLYEKISELGVNSDTTLFTKRLFRQALESIPNINPLLFVPWNEQVRHKLISEQQTTTRGQTHKQEIQTDFVKSNTTTLAPSSGQSCLFDLVFDHCKSKKFEGIRWIDLSVRFHCNVFPMTEFRAVFPVCFFSLFVSICLKMYLFQICTEHLFF
ncbi:hypothetical protein RFI_12015 [Reticulomyxa filosa]|uniref:K Homology domain-containing protein n=1 Tax=Reticulomyxa filosa TaxID=46433 RepID=X6NGU2_RETFI|nr:hypothetical protein RFI_12015 [Reticulomyxa filosa]|eukprot:ETO25128.1 hypothetical protein RFI_12015 [Reticulomyxa filosa]